MPSSKETLIIHNETHLSDSETLTVVRTFFEQDARTIGTALIRYRNESYRLHLTESRKSVSIFMEEA